MWNFPDSPTEGTLFTDAASGAQYKFTNGVWMSVSAAQIKMVASGENIIVNPAFLVSQENGITVGTANGYFLADQWGSYNSGMGVYNAASFQGSGLYAGYISNNTITASPAASAYAILTQRIEGIMLQSLKWGTADAVPAVLSFETQANAAGTFSACVQDSAGGQSFVFDFVAPVGNWGKFSVPIPARTVGTWNISSTNMGASVAFAHAAGTTHKASALGWNAGSYLSGPGLTINSATTGNTLYIRNVQLRADPEGTGVNPTFVIPSYDEELARCQRYYQKTCLTWAGQGTTGLTYYGHANYTVTMRATPSLSGVNGGSGNVAAAVGTLEALNGLNGCIREGRACNATSSQVLWFTYVTANARM